MEDFVQYIIGFLLGEQNSHLAKNVAYANESKAPIVIIPSNFFDKNIYMTADSMPQIPLKELEGVPLLFGNEKILKVGSQIIVEADIIASTFFLITRYEECIDKKNRDKYGRIIGRRSLPYRAGFLMRPIVDEYGKLLRKWLREAGMTVEDSALGYKHIYLTHDVDQIWQIDSLYHALRTLIKRVVYREKNVFESLKLLCRYEKYDDIYTFPWLIEMDNSVERLWGSDKCTKVYFIKAGGKSELDNRYYKRTFRVKKLLRFLKKDGAIIGLHLSFSSGQRPEKTDKEKRKLEKIFKEEIKWNRNHYLYSRNPEDMEYLIAAGVTDDFTMGYADVLGFRLGTCRAVRWINPFTKQLTSLMLHPLSIMECTLHSKQYMYLSEEEAYDKASKMLDLIKEFYGEVVLLWHNTSVSLSSTGYQRKLYKKILEKLMLEKNI